jgi:hypothetical protein
MRLCWTPVLLIFSATLLAQPLPVQPCPSDALDATCQATDGPDHGYTLAFKPTQHLWRNMLGRDSPWRNRHGSRPSA